MNNKYSFRSWVMACAIVLVHSAAGILPVGAQELPECKYVDSDIDGDGYGWENRLSCVVTEASLGPAPAVVDGCLDEDGDGWGWNGERICRVAANNCHDSDPVGDGWGWDGTTSCQITAYQAPFSELETLRARIRSLFGSSIGAATLVCYFQEGDELVEYPIDLFGDGSAVVGQPGNKSYRGVWSTGFSDSDGMVTIYYEVGSSRSRARLLLLPGAITFSGAGPGLSSDDCYWAV